MHHPSITLAFALGLSTTILAQGGDGDEGKARTGTEEPAPVADTGKVLKSDRAMTPIRSNFAAAGTIALKPRRLAPSQSGELCFVIMLKDNLVALPGAPVELSFKPGECPCTLGDETVDPPAVGKIASRFRGKPIHEETLILRTPIQIHPDAAFRRYPVEGTVSFPVHDATTGRPLGKLEKRVRGFVHVGKPLPVFEGGDVRVAKQGPTPKQAADLGSRNPGTSGENVPSSPETPSAGSSGPEGRMERPSRSAPVDTDASEVAIREGTLDTVPWTWIFAGAGALGLALILLLRGRRS